VQYAEIRMLTGLQNFVTNTRLTAFNCDGSAFNVLLVVPSDVMNAGTVPCGMVCWGAPGSVSVQDPAFWDPADPNNYVDCVGYGGYTGPRKTSIRDGTFKSGTPTNLLPGDGTMSGQESILALTTQPFRSYRLQSLHATCVGQEVAPCLG